MASDPWSANASNVGQLAPAAVLGSGGGPDEIREGPSTVKGCWEIHSLNITFTSVCAGRGGGGPLLIRSDLEAGAGTFTSSTPTPYTRSTQQTHGMRGCLLLVEAQQMVCGSSVKAGMRDNLRMCSGCLELPTHTPGPGFIKREAYYYACQCYRTEI